MIIRTFGKRPNSYYSHVSHSMENPMITVTSVEAQNRFGELIDRSQRELVEVTRRGRTVAYVVSSHDMHELLELRRRREEATRWYSRYRRRVTEQTEAREALALSDSDVNRLVHELR
jgi:antitoxin Phd